MAPDPDHRIKLQVFEGPLDLLLFLIRKNELDIYDIPIESVTHQYIAALHAMRELDLDLAGEFFVMAATLMEIKSRMLLPRGQHAVDPNAEDDDIDPRWELVYQLLQYKKFKEAAAKLSELSLERQNLMDRHVSSRLAEAGARPLKPVGRIELWSTFNLILRRLAEKLVVGEIHDEVVTVADQMEWLLERLKTEPSFLLCSWKFIVPETMRPLRSTAPSLKQRAGLSATGSTMNSKAPEPWSQKARPFFVTATQPPPLRRRRAVAGIASS